ncbi:hypothetical protein R1flu_027409 [Riccia fluitans]|uniref:DUF569 domain-containing protein n=1 Tax=Riccia fluitans TaxID=41844 RepID=A0ABD1XLM8_9MARC
MVLLCGTGKRSEDLLISGVAPRGVIWRIDLRLRFSPFVILEELRSVEFRQIQGAASSRLMEFFEKARTVRLKSVHGKYLWADDQRYKVYQCKEPINVSAQWRVEHEEGSKVIRLRSSYDTYLTATDDQFLFGISGKKVVQSNPSSVNSTVEWEPIKENSRQFKLKTCHGNFLRANRTDKTATYPYKNSVCHDFPTRKHKHQDYLLWEVEIVWEKNKSSVSNGGSNHSESPERSVPPHRPYVPSANASLASNGDSHRGVRSDGSVTAHRPYVPSANMSSVSNDSRHRNENSDGLETPHRHHRPSTNVSSVSNDRRHRTESPDRIPHRAYVPVASRYTSSNSPLPHSNSVFDDDAHHRSTSAHSPPYSSASSQSAQAAYVPVSPQTVRISSRQEGRTIYYTLADNVEEAGHLDENSEWLSFNFRGHSLNALKKEIKKLLNTDEEVLLCTHHGVHSETIQLKLPTLPPNNAEMHIIVVKANSSLKSSKSGAKAVSKAGHEEHRGGEYSDERGASSCLMEFFENAKTVRLKSLHGKYLWADEDGYKVYQCKEPMNINAQWRVERVPGSNLIRLKSCHHTYLTAVDEEFLMGMTGNKVIQSKPSHIDSSVEWEPLKQNSRQFKLKTCHGNFLRANKAPTYPWRNSVTHDIPTRMQKHQDYLLWEVEIVWESNMSSVTNGGDHRSQSPDRLPTAHTPYVPIANRPISPLLDTSDSIYDDSRRSSSADSPPSSPSSSAPSHSSHMPYVSAPPRPVATPAHRPLQEGRIIYYAVADSVEQARHLADDSDWPSFNFRGHSLNALKKALRELLNIDEDILLCARHHSSNTYKLTLPTLPPNNAEMHIVVVKASSSNSGARYRRPDAVSEATEGNASPVSEASDGNAKAVSEATDTKHSDDGESDGSDDIC